MGRFTASGQSATWSTVCLNGNTRDLCSIHNKKQVTDLFCEAMLADFYMITLERSDHVLVKER